MRYKFSATATVLSIVSFFAMAGQSAAATLSITNYQLVSQKPQTLTKWLVTYKADVVNSGAPFASVSAKVTIPNPTSLTIVKDQDTLNFAPVPANSQVTSTNTFTLLFDRTGPPDPKFATLVWTFTEVPVAPVANAGPNQSATVGKTVTLDGSQSTNPSGIGTLTFSWAFKSVPTGSTASLANATSVNPTFVPDVQGTYQITLTVSNGTASDSATVTVSTTTPPPPVANAGPDQTVNVGATVVLNGSASTSGSGNPLTYAWTLMNPTGSTASLTGANTVSPTFVADKPDATWTATLVVNDGIASSQPSVVHISTGIVAPVANAGPSQTVNVNATVQLDGSASTDANGLPLTYSWTLITVPTGSHATLSSTTAVKPTFVADTSGTYMAQLIVNNGTLSSKASVVTITTNPPLAPTANAGQNQTVGFNAQVQLSGSGTDPQNLPLTFLWQFNQKPTGSNATLSSATIANPTFTADKTGTFILQLVVNNGFLSSAPSTVMISTTCTAPIANAGPAQNVTIGATVTLDGSGSSDACHDTLTYSWTLMAKPTNSTAALTNPTTVSPTFVADLAGTYVAQLIVNNGFQPSPPVTVTITASPQPVISLTPNPLDIPTNGTGTLTVSLSTVVPASAGSGTGQVINLLSSNPGAATVPTTVTIPSGQTSAPVTVTGVGTGSTTITASATGMVSGTATVNVIAALTITTASLPNGVVGVAYPNTTVAASGGTGTLTWSISGQPAGLSINSSTGVISGTPTTAGPNPNVVVTVTDSSTPTPQTASKTFSITITAGLAITTTSLPNGVVGVAYPNTTVAASGGTGTLTWSISGQPAGLSINTSTGVISGTPTTAGPNPNVVVTVTDQSTPTPQTASKTFSITITVGLAITTTSLPNGVVGVAYPNTAVAASGGTGTLTWSISGQPAGLSINTSTGVISGTPTTAGPNPNVVVTVTDQSTPTAQTANKTFSITITAGLAITTTSLPNGVVGVAYPNTTVAASGGTGTLTWSISGQPAGLSINTSTGVISGTPTTAGPNPNVVVTVTDQSTPTPQTANKTFSITINPALAISTASLPSGVVGTAYPSTTVTAANGVGTLTWSLSGQPTGLSINPASGVISGTPTAAGTSSNVVVTVTDSSTPTQTATKKFSITIAPKLTITTTSLPNGQVGVAYPNTTVAASGGTGTLTWSISGQPAGLSINPSTGVISGTPTTAGTSSSVVVTVVDSGAPAQTATATYSITITAPGVPVTVASISVGVALQAPVTLSIAMALPSDLTFTITSSDPTKMRINGGNAGVVSSLSVTIPAGQTLATINIVGVAIGQTTLVAGNGASGQGTETVTPSGFLLLGPGAGPSFTVNQGQTANLIVQVAELDASGNVLSTTQQLAPNTSSISVPLNSTSTSVGTIAPASVTFAALDLTHTATFTAINSGSTTQTSTNLTAGVPAGFSPPAGNGNQVTAFVNMIGCTLPNVTVGKSLETNLATDNSGVHVTLAGTVSSSAGLPVIVSTGDSSKFLLAANPTDVPASQITLTVPQAGSRTPDFYVVGVATGAPLSTASIGANAGSFGSCSATATLASSGFVISASSEGQLVSSFQSGENQQSTVAVLSVSLDASLNPAAFQPVAAAASVTVTSSDQTIGTVTSPVSFTAGQALGTTTFTSQSKGGSTTLSLTTPSGFSKPATNTSVTATVQAVVMHVCGDPQETAQNGPTMIGFHLESGCAVTVSQQTASALTVTLTSNSPGKLLLSTDPTAVGQTSITVTIPAGSTLSNTFYLQGVGCPVVNGSQPMCGGVNSTTATYTASGGGFTDTGTVTLAPSGVFFESGGFFFFASVSGGPVGVPIDLVQLDPNTNAIGNSQPLAAIPGSTTLTISVDTDNHSIGTVTSPVVTAGLSTVNATFTPVAPGNTNLTITMPAGFGSTGMFQTTQARVSP